jgi:hypothetical protein
VPEPPKYSALILSKSESGIAKTNTTFFPPSAVLDLSVVFNGISIEQRKAEK